MTAENTHVMLGAADPAGAEAMQLLRDMRAEALRRYSDVLEPSASPPANDPLVPRSAFLIARLGREPVECAALRLMDENAAEVRRMYVAPSVRRQGIGRRLLAALQQMASEFGYDTLRLETGARQPEAIALYESYGFHRIPRYGCHVDDPVSICFEKTLARAETAPTRHLSTP